MKTLAEQIAISELADKYIDQAIKDGFSFSEGLCSWAWFKAEQEYEKDFGIKQNLAIGIYVSGNGRTGA